MRTNYRESVEASGLEGGEYSMEKKGLLQCVRVVKKDVLMMGVGGQPIIAVKRDLLKSRFHLLPQKHLKKGR